MLLESNVQQIRTRFVTIARNEVIIELIVQNLNVHIVHHLLIKQQEVKAHMVIIQTEKVSTNYHQKTQLQLQHKRQTRKLNLKMEIK